MEMYNQQLQNEILEVVQFGTGGHIYNSDGGGRSMTSSRGHSESVYYDYGNPSPVEFGMDKEVITEPVDSSRA
ncbi:hypothetical protein JHK82_055545 [Glycine max]|nr:hypothetical protein JHK82_055545 [Glycine max]